jgi:hypothetical protein
VRAIFEQYVDCQRRATRFDCRNFSITRALISRLVLDGSPFFVEGAGPSVSGSTSARWRAAFGMPGNEIRFHPELIVRHVSVRSLWREVGRYFRWGRNGKYSKLYATGHKSLLQAFVKSHFVRHFINPIFGGVSPIYFWSVHLGYWIGIAKEALETRRRT